jgi:hypothetical protein
MDALPIIVPLPELSGEDALEFAEFLYELAGRFEASYRDSIEAYYRAVDECRADQRDPMLFDTDNPPQQLELFDQLATF